MPVLGFLLLQGLVGPTAFGATAEAPEADDSAVSNPIPVSASSESESADPAAELARDEELKRTLQELEQYEARIAELENSQGAYGADIGEIYMDAGVTLQYLGRHEEAALAFGKALQAVRVSNGLNNVQQLPILEELKESNEQLQKWDEVDTSVHLLFHIAKNNYPVGDVRRLQALKELGRWKMQDAEDQLTPGNSASADEAFDIYKNEIELLESTEDYDGKNLHLATAYLDRASIDLWLAGSTYNRSLSEFQTAGTQRSVTTTQCQMVRMRDGSVVQICNTVEVPNMDYYLEPSARKGQEIQGYLNDMKRTVLQAYTYLENQEDRLEEKNELLKEVVYLTEQYNDFVNNSSSDTPLAMRRNASRDALATE